MEENMTRPKQPRGFSAVELAVVILLIGIIVAFSVPSALSYVRNYQMMAAAQNVATQVQRARSQVVRRNSHRGFILNFDYPNADQYQYTSMDEDPVNGGWDGNVYPGNPGAFNANLSRDYGIAPAPPANVTSPAADIPSPHGLVMDLPNGIEFLDGTYSSLLFRTDGSVEAVNSVNVGSQIITENGLNWEIRIRQTQTGLTRTILISRNGRVAVTTP
jgi:prepilin-type N-terminal cleavage/methylation domain-containing protein